MHSGPSADPRKFLRSFSIILGLLYFFAGICVSGVTGIRYYYNGMPPDERIYWFQYGNGTPLFPDKQTLGLFVPLSFITILLLISSGFMILFLIGKYLQGNDGYFVRNRDDTYLDRIPSRILAKTCKLISISAWLACLTITGIFFIGFPVSDGIWVFYFVWILAILQTFFVWKLKQEFAKGK